MASDELLVEQIGKILKLQFNRPEKKNSLTQAMYRSIISAFDAADADDSIHCILLQGTRDCFCAGNDLKDFLEAEDLVAAEFVKKISKVKKPIVAAVNGPAIGVGTTMLLHCDLIVAAQDAFFMMPFTDLGLCPEAGASYLIPRALGHCRASELLLLGDKISAAEALDLGLINKVCSAEDYQNVAWEMAQRLAGKPLEAVMVSKALMRGQNEPQLEQAINAELEKFEQLLRSDAAREAISRMLA